MNKLVARLVILVLAASAIFPAMISTSALAAEITGTVEIDAALKGKLQPSAVLYITAKNAESGRGMPLAVMRVPQPIHFPVSFSLSEANAMIPGTKLEGKIAVSARVNQSGSAGPAQPGDLEPAQPLIVEAGAKKSVVIRISREK
jgi:hypothetical protein